MSDKANRKAALASYKERKTPAGVYAVKCAATARVWVGQSVNLDAVRNRLWFTLQTGSHVDPQMLADWKAHGRESFTFEILDTAKDDDTPYDRDVFLKDRAAHWRSQLGALPV